MPNLVPERADAGPAVSLQLAQAVGDRRGHVVDVLLPPLPRLDQRSAGRGVSDPPDATHSREPAGDLGWACGSPQPPGPGFHREATRTNHAGAPSSVCTGAQSCRVSVGVLEAARATQLLPARLRSAELPCAPRLASHAPAPHPRPSFLATGRAAVVSNYIIQDSIAPSRCAPKPQRMRRRPRTRPGFAGPRRALL